MKKMTKVLLVAALGCGVAGTSFAVVSLLTGFRAGDFRTAVENGRFELAGTDWIEQAGAIVTDRVADEFDFEETYADVDALSLDVGVASCIILPGDGDEWTVTGYNLPSRFQSSLDGGTLDISCDAKSWSFFGLGKQTAILEIRAPRSGALREVRIDVGAGTVEAQEMLVCEELEVSCGVGTCDIYADVTRSAEIDCGIGDVKLTLAGQLQDFEYDLDCGIGEITLDGQKYSGFGDDTQLTYGADKDVSIDCSIGRVVLSFDNES